MTRETGASLAGRISTSLFARTPLILQSEAAECGLAAMAMVAGHHGHRMDMAAIRRRFSASIKGTTLRDLVSVGSGLGLATRALRLEPGDLGKLRLPCILHWGHNHFVVLTKVRNGSIVIHDPAKGRRTVPMAEVSRQMTGVALEAWPAEGFTRRDETARLRVTTMLARTTGLWRTAFQVLAISLAIEAAVIAMPIGFQLVLDEVVVAADYDLLTLIALGLFLLLIVQVAATFARAWVTMLVGSSLALQWKVALFDQLQRLPLSFFEKRHVGDVVSRFSSVDAVQQTLTTSAIQAILDGIMSVTLIVMMWLYGGWLLWIALASVAVYSIMRLLYYRPYRGLSEEAIVAAAQENSHFMESVRGMSSIKVLNLEERRRGVWSNHLVERINAQLAVSRFDAVFSAGNGFLFGVDRILMIYLGGRAILAGDLSIGMLVAFLAYKDQFAARVASFIDTMLQFAMLSLHGERLADIAFAEPEKVGNGAAAPVRNGENRPAAITLSGVGFRYAENDAPILSGFHMHVAAGECVGIAGPSGVGKSTLLKLMAGLAEPETGQVLVDGVPLASIGLNAHRERVGCVLQEDRLFAGSIAENISAFDPAPDPAWIQAVARMANIHDEIMRMPMGYETLVGDMGSSLSGGQKQRVVLARAVYRRPALLLMDEATSHLDPDAEAAINAAVRHLPMTRILIAHRPSTLQMADRVVTLAPPGAAAQAAE